MLNNQLLGSMHVFISVADSGSFSESARRLGLSQPSVSRQINNLETHLGVRLLQRTTRKLSLTEAGQIYYEKARQIYRDVLEADQSVRGFKESPSGLLRISAPHTWNETRITPHIGEFLQIYPNVNLEIECNDSVQDIIEDRLDLVIRVGYLKDSSYIAIPLAKIRMVLCATPDYIQQHGTPKTASDLQNHNFIYYEDYKQFVCSDKHGDKLIHINGSVSSNTVSIMLSALRQNIGISLIPDLLIGDCLQSGKLIDLMPEATFKIKNLPIDHIYALYSNRKHLPAKVRAFLDFYREKF
ncbi:Transcriptional regulator, LysR family [hydrothermal vent metagenome]|uniref:Transcriptional regulator, LysR family n=1 Tax=hydrothermal vent metagenome TaxID=652676 RepID=A0A3B0XGK5_9ZZZZ